MIRNLFILGGISLTVAILLVGGVATTAFVGTGEAIQKTISETGSRVFKSGVTVAEASLAAKTAETQLIGVRVKNPPGFSDEFALHLPLTPAQVLATSELEGTIHIEDVLIERPNVLLEIVAGRANLPRLRDSARSAVSADVRKPAGHQFTVGTLRMQGGVVTLRADFLGKNELTAAMPEMQLENLGKRTGGLGADTLMNEIIGMFIVATERAVRRIDLAAEAARMDLPAPEVDLSSIVLDQGEQSQ